MADLCPDQAWLVAPVDESYPLQGGVKVANVGQVVLQSPLHKDVAGPVVDGGRSDGGVGSDLRVEQPPTLP